MITRRDRAGLGQLWCEAEDACLYDSDIGSSGPSRYLGDHTLQVIRSDAFILGPPHAPLM